MGNAHNRIAVTILTGKENDSIWHTFASLNQDAPELVDHSHVTVLYNGDDPTTAAALNHVPWINVLDVTGQVLPVGMAYSRLFTQIPVNLPFHLHLEEGWVLDVEDLDWLDFAKVILAEDLTIGQVRLKHRSWPIRKYNPVNGKEIFWHDSPAGFLIGGAHYVLDPALMRSQNVLQLWPANTELAAMQRFRGMVAQLDPGVFRFTGNKSMHQYAWG